MSKSYADYSAARRAELTGAGAEAVAVFDRAYALGALLADARRQRGLNQTELARRSGVTQADISRIERGVLSPTTPTLMRLAEGLNARITLELLAEAEPVEVRKRTTRSPVRDRAGKQNGVLDDVDAMTIAVEEVRVGRARRRAKSA